MAQGPLRKVEAVRGLLHAGDLRAAVGRGMAEAVERFTMHLERHVEPIVRRAVAAS